MSKIILITCKTTYIRFGKLVNNIDETKNININLAIFTIYKYVLFTEKLKKNVGYHSNNSHLMDILLEKNIGA